MNRKNKVFFSILNLLSLWANTQPYSQFYQEANFDITV